MGAEKKISKGKGGFFNLFDWSGKSRKKLFSNDFDLPERRKQGKRSEENLPSTRLHLIEGDEIGALSVVGSSDFSCASSVTDEEVTGIKPPSVVARLMGLDTFPGPYVAEPNSTPFFDARSLQEAGYQKKTTAFCSDYQNGSSKSQISRLDGFSRNELRPLRTPSSPIERFQTETLPPKSAKSLPITQHKLLSPIKNPGFVSTKNANDIMEAAAKIIEPGLQANSKGKLSSVVSTSVPIKIRDLKENVRVSQRKSNLPDVSRRPVESNAVKYLKGQSMTKSWNGPEDIPSFKASSDMERNCSFDVKNKGKSVSLAVQAKVNVQKREALNSSRSSLVTRDENRQKSTEPFKSQQNTGKNNQNKSSVGQKSSSGVLRQNNQKQNFLTNKSKLPKKPLASNNQGRKSVAENTSQARGISYKVSGNYKDGNKNQPLGTINLEKDAPPSRTRNIQRKKQAIGGGELGDRASVDKDDKKTDHSNTTISEHLDLGEESRNGMDDVVSFTFTSPMRKPMPGSRSSRQTAEKQDKTRNSNLDHNNENNASELKNTKVSSLGLNVIGGDALSILLEQKLRELAMGVESSCYHSGKVNMSSSSSSILQDVLSSVNALSIMPEGQGSSERLYKDKPGSDFSSYCSTTNGEEFNANQFQGIEGMVEDSSSINIQKRYENQHRSPVSILEASISNGSANSSESLDCSNRSQTCSSIQSQATIGSDSSMNAPGTDVDTELSDSASSAFTGAAVHSIGHMRTDEKEVEHVKERQCSAIGHMRTDDKEVEYVKEIICSADFKFMNLPLGRTHGNINLHLFNRLEIQIFGSRNEEENKENRLKRKELFDCVSECIDLKCSRYNSRGYKAWSKGVMVLREERLSEEIYTDILGWRSVEDLTADELIEKDMSSHLGTWLDFEFEQFEIGVEIGRRILSSLVMEAVADMLV